MAVDTTTKAYQYLWEEILAGRIPLGSPISETEVASALNISRSPVREALKKMEAEGVINHFPGRGAFVIQMNAQDLEEIFDLRLLLELFALETAYQYVSDETLNSLQQTILTFDEKTMDAEYLALNKRLHDVIISSCGNKRLQKFYEMLGAQIQIITKITAKVPDHFSSASKDHLELIQAMKNRNYEESKKVLTRHIKSVKEKTIYAYLHIR